MDVRPGDAIILTAMLQDPDPIESGATGKVLEVFEHGEGAGAWKQITVAWDNGRSLMLVSPPDIFEVMHRSER